jgi:dihydrofolate synthase/folylpolyglutamate synthase
MNLKDLSEWLNWIKSLSMKQIDLDLMRVTEMAKRMNLLKPPYQVITVAGTNGKGSTVAGLEAIYLEAGYRVGAFTSPFLFSYNEQIRILGASVSDDEIISAFKEIEKVREKINLTPFEYTTLAALVIFSDKNLDVCILEVGLGGRLDAVNVLDPDLAIITSIDLDHVELLGDTREKIAHEKAGIMRAGKPVICGDFNPPQALLEDAKKIAASLYCQNNQFGYETDGFLWNWWSEQNRLEQLPQTKLLLQNMASVLMAIELLQSKLAVKREAIDSALKKVSLPGRIQVVEGDVTHVYDVSHNPASVSLLKNYLQEHLVTGKTYAVFSMLGDKDIPLTLSIIKNSIDEWYVAPLGVERGATLDMLTQYFLGAGIDNILWFNSIVEAYGVANAQSRKGDRVIVFGSFHTVADVLHALA